MKRILTATAAAALGLSLLTACGGDGESSAAGGGDYCGDLKTAAKRIDAVTSGDLGSFQETADQMHTLRDEAPDAVADDWEVVSGAVDKVIDALEQAGVDEDDLTKLQSGDASLPAGVDLEALQQALTEIQDLASDGLTQAGARIAEHAKSECGVDLKS